MQSQIEYELDVLKSGNYDHALQFIEHLVNILVRMKRKDSNTCQPTLIFKQIKPTHGIAS